MRAGTRSVVFGVHQFAIHPFVVAFGWFRAFGWARVPMFPADGARMKYTTRLTDPRLWLAFLVHDVGLIGKPDMDGPIGETHPEVGARFMRRVFGAAWGDFVLLHSRYYAKRRGRPVSALCIADKWAIVVEPTWLYLPRAWVSGELREYMRHGVERATRNPEHMLANEREDFLSGSALRWHRACRSYMRRWLAVHSDGRPDTWTPLRHAAQADNV